MEEHVIYLDQIDELPGQNKDIEGFDIINQLKTEQEQPLIKKVKDDPQLKPEKFKRRYFTRISWLITLIGSVFGLIFADAYFGILITLILISSSTTVTIMTVYIITGPRYFNASAYCTVIASYIFAFTKIILFILDTAECFSNGTKNFALEIIWEVLYWSSMIFNFIWIQFIYVYWTQDHPDLKRRIKATLRYFLFFGAIIGGIAVVLLIILVIAFWNQLIALGFAGLINMIILIIQIINMSYSWLFYFLLLGYGISAFPYNVFTSTDTTKVIYKLIAEMKATQKSFEYAVNKYIKNTNYLRLLCDKLLNEHIIDQEVISYAKTIQQSINTYREIIKFNGVAKYNEKIESDFRRENYKDKEAAELALTYTIDKLADMYMTNQNYIFSFEKNEKMLLKNYYSIRKLCNIGDSRTIFYRKEKTKEDDEVSGRNSEYKLPLKVFSCCRVFTAKLGGVLLMIFSIIFYLIQLSIPIFHTIVRKSLPSLIDSSKMFYPLIIILMIYCIYVIICSYYALAKFKKLESYTLVAHHTDKYAMLNNAGMLNAIVFGIIYNVCLFSYEEAYTTNITMAFAFFSQKGEGLTTIILWVYPLFFTLFGVVFILRLIGFKLTWLLWSLDTDCDIKEQIAALKDIDENRATIGYSTDDMFLKFLENFEQDYYELILSN